MGFLSVLEEEPLAFAGAEPIVPRARPAAPVADVLSHCRRVVDCAMKPSSDRARPAFWRVGATPKTRARCFRADQLRISQQTRRFLWWAEKKIDRSRSRPVQRSFVRRAQRAF